MLRVETIVKFHDLKEECIREIGDQFTVSKERYQVLKKRGFVREVKIAPEQPEEQEETAAE